MTRMASMSSTIREFLIPSSVIALALSASACGPVNNRPSGTSAGGNASGAMLADDPTTPQYSEKQQFIFRMRPVGVRVGKVAALAQPGDNVYEIRVKRAEDWASVSSDAKLFVQYSKLKSTGQVGARPPSKIAAERQADGDFRVNLNMRSHGTWLIKLHLVDGSVEDDHVFRITF